MDGFTFCCGIRRQNGHPPASSSVNTSEEILGATGRCQWPDQIDVVSMKSNRRHGYGLKCDPNVAVDLGSYAGEAHADPLFNIFSHPWSYHSPADDAVSP